MEKVVKHAATSNLSEQPSFYDTLCGEGLRQKKKVKRACEKKGCFVLHNNWFTGRLRKLERQVLSGLWEYDISTRMSGHEKQEGIEPRKLLITGNAEEMCSVLRDNQAQRQGNQKEESIWRSYGICGLESLDLVIKGCICEDSSCR
ncbi:hypothetical protein Q3G72_001392 [Acer saccharum]|nr:hypothetical protein Q3G72_001392 [Acer saccharum]